MQLDGYLNNLVSTSRPKECTGTNSSSYTNRLENLEGVYQQQFGRERERRNEIDFTVMWVTWLGSITDHAVGTDGVLLFQSQMNSLQFLIHLDVRWRRLPTVLREKENLIISDKAM